MTLVSGSTTPDLGSWRTGHPTATGALSPGLTVFSRSIRGIPVVVVGGDIDVATAPALARHLAANLARPEAPRTLAIDLQHVEFLGMAGLKLLATAHRQAAARGIQLRIIANTQQVLRALTVSGLDNALSVHATESAALHA